MLELNKIYHADCMDGMAELPQGHKYCVVTDPPFNVGYHYNEYNDRKEEGEYFQWLQDITNGYPCVIIHYPEALYKFAFQIGQFPERVVAWVYNSNTPRQHRDIAYFGIKPDFTLMHQPYKNPTDKRIAKRIAEGHEGGQIIPINVCAGDTASTLTSRMWKDAVTNYLSLAHYPSTAVLIEHEL